MAYRRLKHFQCHMSFRQSDYYHGLQYYWVINCGWRTGYLLEWYSWRDVCYSGAIPDGGGDLQVGMDGRTAQATDRGYLPAKAAIVLSASTGPECGGTTACGLLPIWWREPKRTSTRGVACQLALCSAREAR